MIETNYMYYAKSEEGRKEEKEQRAKQGQDSKMAAPSRIAEKLLLTNDRGEGLLLRLYRLRSDLNASGSELAFLRSQKPFVGLAKALASSSGSKSSSSVAGFKVSAKDLEEMAKMKAKVKKHLSEPTETLLAVKDFVSSAIEES